MQHDAVGPKQCSSQCSSALSESAALSPSLDAVRGEGERPENSPTRRQPPCYQQSGFGPPSERSTLEEKTVNCSKLETNGRKSHKVLASLRRVPEGADCDQRREVRSDSRIR